MRATGHCRGCGAPIRFGKEVRTGTPMPLDPTPVDDGNIWIEGYVDGFPLIHICRNAADVPAREALRYQSHFRSCPQRNEPQ